MGADVALGAVLGGVVFDLLTEAEATEVNDGASVDELEMRISSMTPRIRVPASRWAGGLDSLGGALPSGTGPLGTPSIRSPVGRAGWSRHVVPIDPSRAFLPGFRPPPSSTSNVLGPIVFASGSPHVEASRIEFGFLLSRPSRSVGRPVRPPPFVGFLLRRRSPRRFRGRPPHIRVPDPISVDGATASLRSFVEERRG